MSLKDVKPGKYTARVVDYGIVMVEKLNQPKAFIEFTFKNGDADESITWDGFLTKKDGELNKKTLDTLITCGFKGKAIAELNNSGVLDTQKEVSIEVIQDGEYLRVEWVNSTERVVVKADVKRLKGMNLSKVDSYLALANKKPLVNHADGIGQPPKMDDSEDLPF